MATFLHATHLTPRNLRMQRQKSILSSQNSTGGNVKGQGVSQFPSKQQSQKGDIGGSSLEVIGTDTPPEKVPRKVLPASFAANAETGVSSSLFSSIMHKFVKVEDMVNGSQKNQAMRFNLMHAVCHATSG